MVDACGHVERGLKASRGISIMHRARVGPWHARWTDGREGFSRAIESGRFFVRLAFFDFDGAGFFFDGGAAASIRGWAAWRHVRRASADAARAPDRTAVDSPRPWPRIFLT